jgi:hypothetical protein
MKENPPSESISKLVILFIITCGMYIFYWSYRNWKFLKEKDGEIESISPGLRTFGLLIPFVNLFLIYGLFDDIIDNAKRKGVKTYITSGGMLLALIVVNALSLIHWILSFLNIAILVRIQIILNDYAAKLKAPKPEFKFDITDQIFIAFGIVLWAIIIAWRVYLH